MPRAGFSLIELLVVIIVIGILAALLLPAIAGVRQRVREAQVTVDIGNLDKAIGDFKLAYGAEPPSSFSLHEDGVWDMSNPLDRNSVAFIRQIWPQYSLVANAGNMEAAIDPGDVNGDGDATDDLILNGSECLAFFLGGIYARPSAGVFAPQGFSSKPDNPFASGGSGRKGPFFSELPTTRFKNVEGDAATNPEQMPELLDTLPNQQNPYLYLSSYNGRGYQPAGYDGTLGNADDEVISGALASGVYVISAGGPAHNSKTYQIISPGFDGEYGPGGAWTKGAIMADTKGKDDITNFSGGRLE